MMAAYELADEEVEGLLWLVANTQLSLSHPKFGQAVLARQAAERLAAGLQAKQAIPVVEGE